MKNLYIDIIEKSLSAYTDERIRDYIEEVKRDGLTEHGFPRLGANMGILIAYGRRTELLDTFIEIMDICCEEIPLKKAANDFTIREVCCCLMLLEEKGIVGKELLDKWKSKLATFNPWEGYTVIDDHSGKFVNNWALFAAVSEFVRGVYCGIDTTEFVEWQLPCQIANLDCNDMYRDGPDSNPMLYDYVARFLMTFLLHAGYKGKYAARIEQALDNTAEISLQMQSVTGETSFGGRSNQFVHNESLYCSYCEMEATRFAKKGDMIRAGEFRAAALLAAESILHYLNVQPISHVKNRYPVSTKIGCEKYAYFNKYMITTASMVYPALLFSDDSIQPAVPLCKKAGYVVSTSEEFHKTFINAAGYTLELEIDADFYYDANGLGRVHKEGCPATICLSTPFAPSGHTEPCRPQYVIEGDNESAMSICCYAVQEDKKLLGATKGVTYTLVDSMSGEHEATAVFDVALAQDIVITHEYRVTRNGVDIMLSGYEDTGFMVPVFEYDGEKNTQIKIAKNAISVQYQNAVCKYSFEGDLSLNYEHRYNRNGRYRVYEVATKNLHIEIGEKQ